MECRGQQCGVRQQDLQKIAQWMVNSSPQLQRAWRWETVPQGHGKQSEQHQPSVTAQKTAQSEPVSAQNITEILTEIPMRRNTHKPYSKSLPATKAMIQQQIKTKYVVGTKGLSEEQLTRACATTYAEVWAEMDVVANQQYGLGFRTH